jgi:DNA repair protein RadC
MSESQSIKHWSNADKPREKLMEKGKEALSNAELIAILLGSGNPKESAVALSQRIMHSIENNLVELSKLGIKELQEFNGIGEAKAISIIAAMELGRRRRESEVMKKAQIRSSKDVFELMQPVLADKNYEEFWILLTNRANKVIRKIQISDGGVSGTVADPKRIFKHALENLASGIILCHNHPSSNLTPSQEDIHITRKAKHGGKLLDIQVLDHLIFGDEKYYSFADEGKLDEL